MSTSGKGGETLKKTATVITDDPKNAQISLYVTGQVEKMYTMTPGRVIFKGVVGDPLEQKVVLIPEKAYPFTIEGITAKRGDNIKFEYRKVKEQSGVGYELTVENTRKEVGIYFDTLTLKTDSKLKPEIQINIIGNITRAPDKPAEKTAVGS